MSLPRGNENPMNTGRNLADVLTEARPHRPSRADLAPARAAAAAQTQEAPAEVRSARSGQGAETQSPHTTIRPGKRGKGRLAACRELGLETAAHAI